jgi:hypothetical protein
MESDDNALDYRYPNQHDVEVLDKVYGSCLPTSMPTSMPTPLVSSHSQTNKRTDAMIFFVTLGISAMLTLM